VRKHWDQIWSEFASSISDRSCDPKFKVGAVIVTDDNTQVLSVGYNGDQKGGSNQRESEDTGKSGFIHAEVNALIKMDYNNPKRKIMYVTHSPCSVCAKCIINANVSEVVYLNLYKKDTKGIEILKNSNIIVRSLDSYNRGVT
jgi:dCMP deaminase